MLKEGFASAEEDMQARALREARVEAERMDLATQAAMAADGDLLLETERLAIEALVQRVREAARGDDAAAIDAAVKTLADGTEPFAAARMNRGIRQALTGRGIDEI
jgi:molecular chaperone HscA